MTRPFALTGAAIFDGARMWTDRALVVAAGRVAALVPLAEAPAERVALDGLTLAPGFVDWQVNGGGGVQFNADPSPEGIAVIARAHARFGTTTLIPTLITDRPQATAAAAAAVAEALRRGIPGVAGVHFEGPHLAPARRGAHDADLMRAMTAADRALLARGDLGRVVATVAVEQTTPADVAALARAGVVVSLGHTDADHDTARGWFDAGVRAVTHLFNAMAPFGHRAPGLVGAALADPRVWIGLIADGVHVHPAALGAAVRAKAGGRVTLVTDAMAPVGAAGDAFTLNGRTVRRADGRLTLPDGTLAGSDLDMASAVRFMVRRVGLPLPKALAMATRAPARLLGLQADRGWLGPGARADMVALDADLRAVGVWIGGRAVGAEG